MRAIPPEVFLWKSQCSKAGRWIREIRMRKPQYEFLLSSEACEIWEYLEGRNLSVLKEAGGMELYSKNHRNNKFWVRKQKIYRGKNKILGVFSNDNRGRKGS